jgi:DNA-binding response OmpR family regulator
MSRTSLVAVDLPSVLEEAVRRAVAAVGAQQVAIIAEYPAHLPAIRAQADDLTSAVEAMVRLVVSWIPQGEVRVRAELGSAEGTGGVPAAAVSVRIPPGQVPESAIPTLEHGLGSPEQAIASWPDLAPALALVESWGGQLAPRWSKESGAELRLQLPLWATRELAPGVQAVQRAVESGLQAVHPGARTLLLMVEEADLRALLASELEQAGYAVVVSERGADVLPLVREHKPDMVLLDVMLRDPPPFDLAMLIKQDRTVHNTPVLFLTTGGEDEDRGGMGAVGFVVRPSGTGAILSAVQAVLSAGVNQNSRVMVVEPDPAIRENMIVMLQQQSFRVTEAAGAEEALVLAERLEPAVVLVNSQVAEARDYWLMRRLRRLSEAMQIMVMAEAMSEAAGRAAMRRGASGFGETGKLPDLLAQVRPRSTSH